MNNYTKAGFHPKGSLAVSLRFVRLRKSEFFSQFE